MYFICIGLFLLANSHISAEETSASTIGTDELLSTFDKFYDTIDQFTFDPQLTNARRSTVPVANVTSSNNEQKRTRPGKPRPSNARHKQNAGHSTTLSSTEEDLERWETAIKPEDTAPHLYDPPIPHSVPPRVKLFTGNYTRNPKYMPNRPVGNYTPPFNNEHYQNYQRIFRTQSGPTGHPTQPRYQSLPQAPYQPGQPPSPGRRYAPQQPPGQPPQYPPQYSYGPPPPYAQQYSPYYGPPPPPGQSVSPPPPPPIGPNPMQPAGQQPPTPPSSQQPPPLMPGSHVRPYGHYNQQQYQYGQRYYRPPYHRQYRPHYYHNNYPGPANYDNQTQDNYSQAYRRRFYRNNRWRPRYYGDNQYWQPNQQYPYQDRPPGPPYPAPPLPPGPVPPPPPPPPPPQPPNWEQRSFQQPPQNWPQPPNQQPPNQNWQQQPGRPQQPGQQPPYPNYGQPNWPPNQDNRGNRYAGPNSGWQYTNHPGSSFPNYPSVDPRHTRPRYTGGNQSPPPGPPPPPPQGNPNQP